jgi:hypothetical protein
MTFRSGLVLGFTAVLACAPAWAQSSNGNPPAQQQQAAGAGNPEIGTATVSSTGVPPSERNPLLTDNEEVRISKLLGTEIYNKNNKEVGTVEDVLANQSGQVVAVVSTNGKRVVVPWSDLTFGDAKLNSHNKVLMLNATPQSVAAMPPFTPKNQGKKG